MNWLRKMRRAWIAVFTRFTRHRKSTGNYSRFLFQIKIETDLCLRKKKKVKLSLRLKLRFIIGESSSSNSANNHGLVKLKDDVEMCGYEDVQIMWDILNKSTRRRNCRTTSDCDGGNDNGNAFTLFFGRHTIDPVPLFTLEQLNYDSTNSLPKFM